MGSVAQQGQREVRKVMPVEGTEYDKFFGTSVPHDSVVLNFAQDTSFKEASNYNEKEYKKPAGAGRGAGGEGVRIGSDRPGFGSGDREIIFEKVTGNNRMRSGEQGQREVRKVMPVEGTEYDKFFGTSVPHDSVVPNFAQDKSCKQASNYNGFFGASVYEEDLVDLTKASDVLLWISPEPTSSSTNRRNRLGGSVKH